MSNVLIIGAGGVGHVTAHKCASVPEVFDRITLASRTKSKCEFIQGLVKEKYGRKIGVAAVDAENLEQTVKLIKNSQADMVINVALPYQNQTIMHACLEAGVHYLDTAASEVREIAHYEYKEQWALDDQFKQKGLTAILGCGFDPGVVNVYAAYAKKHFFDTIKYIDILDCNGGSHGKEFATNFNPEINIREFIQNSKHWENGQWVISPSVIDETAVRMDFDYPEIGVRKSYLLFHDELESLAKNIPCERMRFWMTFGEKYLTHLRVLRNVGMTSVDPIEYNGQQIVPLQFLKALLPVPSSLGGENYKGKTCIGDIIEGEKDGQPVKKYIYNISDHAEAFNEVKSQAISYTTGVPAMTGAKLVLTGEWKLPGVWNCEQLNPDPFMADMNKYGLPWKVVDFKGSIQ
jgi:saccharopine dehydrogenase (NAD+, L-lysine-forming)